MATELTTKTAALIAKTLERQQLKQQYVIKLIETAMMILSDSQLEQRSFDLGSCGCFQRNPDVSFMFTPQFSKSELYTKLVEHYKIQKLSFTATCVDVGGYNEDYEPEYNVCISW